MWTRRAVKAEANMPVLGGKENEVGQTGSLVWRFPSSLPKPWLRNTSQWGPHRSTGHSVSEVLSLLSAPASVVFLQEPTE